VLPTRRRVEYQARAGLIQWVQIKTLDETLRLPVVTGSADAVLIHSGLRATPLACEEERRLREEAAAVPVK
jgi:hypothetical protein